MIWVSGGDTPPLRWLLEPLVHPGLEAGAGGPAGGGVLATIAALPDSRRARFVVPADPGLAARSLRAFNRLRPPRVAAVRTALALGLEAGAGRLMLRHRVVIGAATDAGAGGLGGEWLVEELRRRLGLSALRFAAGTSPHGPFAKPTLQLFDGAGRPVAYAKVGWTAPARRIVAREADVLEGWPASHPVEVPPLLHSFGWHGRHVTVTAPMPATARRLPARQGVPVEHARLVAGAHGLDAAALATAEGVPDAPALLARIAEHESSSEAHAAWQDVERLGDVVVPLGVAHGDWVPWNLARDGGRLVAWDWEHALDRAPLGVDLVHWAYQDRVVLRREPQRRAFERALEDADPMLRSLGLSAPQRRAAVAYHRFLILTREARADVEIGRCP